MPNFNAYLSLGSNLGDRRFHLDEALRRLAATPGLRIVCASGIYETTPVGVTGQGDYLNAVVEVETMLSAPELLACCLAIETACGRTRVERWSPRTLDIDLLWHSGCPACNTPGLTLPHPRMTERAFVMVPLSVIAPDLVIGALTAREHATRLGTTGVRLVA
ncbi:2-amino-4-hydroxy-6-hydroxymethyldihydropteridine diphosphokinase [Opitutaceae bacterium TAV4]|uniref:2-amino-4-hydroxy-6- hydroxymethyldihydropteridine diphosphokinase n=1 Tax=Geminisphaera colitermitum TaxID=1148786 RepID=UPI0001964EA6|nr:2-amino-4-hydroxy-6-hydroxymethyldihydropteridine diphosphokinase [Geminisphaera colitermitum]RRJ94548.1 2-amino-4-hydroxy-6-hydroxymethyldihydropteridine diphosphokinase [Opitutaceae bacterium TAV4]RRJ98608.1 2-amino-4-hydroxy-6-hydroxymethyldihydropteridine diphosphokinase [Opitutaceae bacterium TAV3]